MDATPVMLVTEMPARIMASPLTSRQRNPTTSVPTILTKTMSRNPMRDPVAVAAATK